MTSPFVTIGMPVYNGGEALRHALDSLLAQTHTNFELIISDNASTDATTQTLTEEYARRDSRIRLIRQPMTQTATENFQFVLEQARGEYFLWAAHDDQWSSNYLEVLAAQLERAPDAILATPRTRIETTTRTGEKRVDDAVAAPNADRWATLDVFVKDNLCVWIYGMFRTVWLKEAAHDLTQYQFHGGDMVWMYDVILRGQIVGDGNATFFYNVVHGKKKDRSNRQKIRLLATEIYHLTRLTHLRLPAAQRLTGMRRVIWFLNRHRFSLRNPIGTSVHLIKLAALGTWFGLELGIRRIIRPGAPRAEVA